MSDDLKVPKRRAPVELLLHDGSARQVTVFLAEFASTHSGPERLSDLLNGRDEFVPALDVATDQMTFVGRQSIAAARVAPEWEADEALAGGHDEELEIVLATGVTLRGRVSILMPPERSRLLDYLNDAQPFIRLVEESQVALVHKRHVARVGKAR